MAASLSSSSLAFRSAAAGAAGPARAARPRSTVVVYAGPKMTLGETAQRLAVGVLAAQLVLFPAGSAVAAVSDLINELETVEPMAEEEMSKIAAVEGAAEAKELTAELKSIEGAVAKLEREEQTLGGDTRAIESQAEQAKIKGQLDEVRNLLNIFSK